MTDLLKLSLTEARDGLRAKAFSSKELTDWGPLLTMWA